MPDKYGFETMEDVLNANAARSKMKASNMPYIQDPINMSDDDLWLKMTREDLDQLWESIYNIKGVKSDLNFKFQSATDEKYWPDNVFKASKKEGKTLNQVLETLVNQGVNKNKIPTIRKVLIKKMNEILLAESNSPTYTYDPIVDVIEAVPVINRGNGNIPRAQAVAISNINMPERDMQVARVVSDDDDDDDEQMTTMEYNPNITIKDDYFGGTRRRRKSRRTRKSRKTRRPKKSRKQRRIRFRR
jgi:hypothetical protein